MQRLLSTLALGGALWLMSCGGGASNVPNPQNNNGNSAGGNQQGTIILGSQPNRSQAVLPGTTLPNQINVRSTMPQAELEGLLARHGYTLTSMNGEFATVTVPSGMTQQAAALLRREYGIFSADPVNVQLQPRQMGSGLGDRSKQLSGVPLDPMYGEFFDGLAYNGTNFLFFLWPGQAAAMSNMGFTGGFDLADDATVAAAPVRVAIIGAGFLDYTLDQADIDPAIIDTNFSGRIDGAGVFTPGLAAAVWDTQVVDDGAGVYSQLPYHDGGNRIFQMMAATRENVNVFYGDLDGNSDYTTNEIWSVGTAGLNDKATYMIIRTGSASGQNWAFTDNELAAAIDFAADPVQGNADIIVMAMSGQAAIGPVLQTAINNARNNNDAMVIAPAGDVVATYDGSNSFTGDPVDIQVTSVSPASAMGVLSVAATGLGRQFPLPDVNIPGPPPDTVPNIGQGWRPRLIYDPDGTAGPIEPADSIFDTYYAQVAPYSNYNASLAACGYAIYYQFDSVFYASGTGSQADPIIPANGYNYYQNDMSERFSTYHATAYVAGAASMVYQALYVANGGSYPADVDTTAQTILESRSDFAPISRIDKALVETPNALASGAGLLNVNKSMIQAISGGTLYQDPMFFTQLNVNQPLDAVTIGTDVTLLANVANGVGPYTLTIDWGNGAGPQVVNNWTPGTLQTLTGGFTTLGPKVLNIEVEDANGQIRSVGANLRVINTLTASIIVTDQTGNQVALNQLQLATNYIFEVRAGNLYTGLYDDDGLPGTPDVLNTTVFNWDFDNSGGAPDATGTAPVFAYTSPGTFTLSLTAAEGFRPNQTFTISVTVQ